VEPLKAHNFNSIVALAEGRDMADAAQRKILAWIQQHPMGVSKQEFEKSFGPIQNHMKEVKALIDAVS